MQLPLPLAVLGHSAAASRDQMTIQRGIRCGFSISPSHKPVSEKGRRNLFFFNYFLKHLKLPSTIIYPLPKNKDLGAHYLASTLTLSKTFAESLSPHGFHTPL